MNRSKQSLQKNDPVKQLQDHFKIDESKYIKFIKTLSNAFSFNTSTHKSFYSIFNKSWHELKYTTFDDTTSGMISTHQRAKRLVKQFGDTKNQNSNICEIIKTSNQGNCYITRFILTQQEFVKLFHHIIRINRWCYLVKEISEIPVTFQQAIRVVSCDMKHIFPNISEWRDELPSFMESIVCTSRYNYHRKFKQDAIKYNSDSDMQAPDDEDDYHKYEEYNDLESEDEIIQSPPKRAKLDHTDDSGYASDDSISSHSSLSSTDSIVVRANKSEYDKLEPESDILLCNNDIVYIRQVSNQIHKKEIKFNMIKTDLHPYTLSCIIFSFSVQISQELEELPKTKQTAEWSARKIYLYIKDWLSDQVPVFGVDPPEQVLKLGKNIIYYLSQTSRSFAEEKFCEQFELLESFFSDVYSMISKHQRRIFGTRKLIRRGSLQSFKLLSHNEFQEMLKTKFHKIHEPDNVREPATLHCQCGDPSCSPFIICFDRNKVGPIQLQTSLDIIERRFVVGKRIEKKVHHHQLWSIAFTDDHTIAVIERNFLYDISRYYLPYLLMHTIFVDRHIPMPVYYIHLHNYYSGDNFGVLTAMKYIMRTFSYGRHHDRKNPSHNLMPNSETDPCIEYYKILHIIISRFQTKDRIWTHLTAPYTNTKLLWFHPNGKRKGALAGIKEDTINLYSALRSFINIYAAHYIQYSTLCRIDEFFNENSSMINRHKKMHLLTQKLLDSHSYGEDYIHIPAIGIFEEDEFPFPSQIIIYYFCTSSDIPDELARAIFLGISCLTKPSGNNGGTHGSAYTRFSIPPTGSKHLKEYKHILSYQSILIKKNLPNDIPSHKEYDAFAYLLQSLEELSLIPTDNIKDVDIATKKNLENYRGNIKQVENYINLTTDEILHNPMIAPNLPIDISKSDSTMIEFQLCLPIWKSSIYDSSIYDDIDFMLSKLNEGRSRIAFGDLELRPFIGCHPDLLECIILQPITAVELPHKSNLTHHIPERMSDFINDMTDNMTTPLDLRVSPVNYSPDYHENEFERRLQQHTMKMISMAQDRKGWTTYYRPSLWNILNKVFHINDE
jgi:hypothetical protein